MGWADVQHPSHPPPQEPRWDGRKLSQLRVWKLNRNRLIYLPITCQSLLCKKHVYSAQHNLKLSDTFISHDQIVPGSRSIPMLETSLANTPTPSPASTIYTKLTVYDVCDSTYDFADRLYSYTVRSGASPLRIRLVTSSPSTLLH